MTLTEIIACRSGWGQVTTSDRLVDYAVFADWGFFALASVALTRPSA